MKTYTDDEVLSLLHMDLDLSETDNQGQIIIYTNLFRWQDGSIRDTPDPTYSDE